MAKIDLHVHSKYSEHPSEWFLQRLGAGESYTDPEYIYREQKSRGMDFITITDHNKIEGALILKAKYPEEVIVGVEATSYFPEDSCKIHILIYGINEAQFYEIQKKRTNIYHLRDYIKEQDLAYSVAHATYSVNGKLTTDHLEKLILLFDVFEVINGGRNDFNNESWLEIISALNKSKIRELQKKHNIEPFGKTPWIKGHTGGSDDHAGLFLGQTWTYCEAQTIDEVLSQIKAKKTTGNGRHNDFYSLVFAIYKIGIDHYKTKSKNISKSMLAQLTDFIFDKKKMSITNRLKLQKLKNDSNKNADEEFKQRVTDLVAELQKDRTQTTDIRLQITFNRIADIADSFFKTVFQSLEKDLMNGNILKLIKNISSIFPSVFLSLPFFSSIHVMFKNRNIIKEAQERFNIDRKKRKKRTLWFTDTITDLNGVAVTILKVLDKVKDYDINAKIVHSESAVGESDHLMQLETIHKFSLPYYSTISINIPSSLKAIKKIYEFKPDNIIVSTPGPVGLIALLAGKLFNIPVTGVYHTDFRNQAYAMYPDENLATLIENYCLWFYRNLDFIRVPSIAYMDVLEDCGLDRTKMDLFPRGLDFNTFYPRKHSDIFLQNKYNVKPGFYFIYTGRVSKDKSLDVILKAFEELAEKYSDIYMFIVGDGPDKEEYEKTFCHDRIIYTGRVERDYLIDYYSGSDLFLFPSETDTFGMSLLEAQACGLPALVSNVGGPKEVIINNETGYIIKESDSDVWQTKMEEMINKSDNGELKKMSDTAVAHIREFANWESFIDTMFN